MVNLLQKTFFESFITLFTEMGWFAAILLIVGVGLCLIEIFEPGFGVFGIIGGVSIISGIIIRSLNNGDIAQFFILLIIVILILLLAFLISMKSIKNGLLSRTAIVENGSSVSTGMTEGTKDFTVLIGKTGITLTTLKPIGKAEIETVIVDVISYFSEMIESGVEVQVVEVEGQKILVKKTVASQPKKDTKEKLEK